jgi:pimeloyl-ACP methyl ester carboxylesterase
VEDVVRLMDRLGLPRAHLVGHSMGAVIAANAALSHPNRVSSVTLLAGPFYTDSTSFAAEIRPFLEDLETRRDFRRFLTWLFPMWSDSMVIAINTQILANNDFGSLVAVFRALPAITITERAASVARIPALAIVGTGDPLLDESQWFAAQWPQARLITLPNVDHFAILFRPELPAQIRRFLPR